MLKCFIRWHSTTGMTEHWPQHEHIYRYTMFRQLGDLAGRLVLDIPCGEGRFAVHILRQGGSVIAVDIAAKMCELTETRARQENLLGASSSSVILLLRSHLAHHITFIQSFNQSIKYLYILFGM